MVACILLSHFANGLLAIYGADGRLQSRFLLSTKNALSDIAGAADELRRNCPLALDGDNGNGIVRSSADLHLLHHQVSKIACGTPKQSD